MQTLNVRLIDVGKGHIKIASDFSERLTQQHGFFHAGVLTNIVDSACGYAALTLMPLDKEVLSVEFKINFPRPANTTKLIATGTVLQSGKTLTVCKVHVYDETETKLLAKMTATMTAVNLIKKRHSINFCLSQWYSFLRMRGLPFADMKSSWTTLLPGRYVMNPNGFCSD